MPFLLKPENMFPTAVLLARFSALIHQVHFFLSIAVLMILRMDGPMQKWMQIELI